MEKISGASTIGTGQADMRGLRHACVAYYLGAVDVQLPLAGMPRQIYKCSTALHNSGLKF
jgi:hypothetical protein